MLHVYDANTWSNLFQHLIPFSDSELRQNESLDSDLRQNEGFARNEILIINY
ncbi:MAG: hypothetical protein IJ756_04470 [Paludibacteraceae bacterium]|nr:hypothetical protein [Paludibacteraceae bacterium]